MEGVEGLFEIAPDRGVVLHEVFFADIQPHGAVDQISEISRRQEIAAGPGPHIGAQPQVVFDLLGFRLPDGAGGLVFISGDIEVSRSRPRAEAQTAARRTPHVAARYR